MTDDYRLDDQVGYKLRLASQRHLEIFSQHLSDITPTQFSILARLYEVGETSQNQLGRLVAMDAATTKGVIARLLEKNLVEARADPNDARRLQISLTETGRELTIDAIEKARKITEDTVANLNGHDVKRLLELLDKI
ncbi:MAG: MarR family winged helix-turn-helix transcriptional regulator [Candidatus Puniceispirillaceae bacterium]|nr:MarR family transcriptional regulator [Pseudomonadota bacterium]MDA0844585.1 MarR family transcriptional regulator [Pseudomonadota bacterium]